MVPFRVGLFNFSVRQEKRLVLCKNLGRRKRKIFKERRGEEPDIHILGEIIRYRRKKVVIMHLQVQRYFLVTVPYSQTATLFIP